MRRKAKGRVAVFANEHYMMPVHYVLHTDSNHNGNLGHITDVTLRLEDWRGPVIGKFENDKTTILNDTDGLVIKAMTILANWYKKGVQ